MISKDKQKEEALLRLEQLTDKFNLNLNIIENFKKDSLYYSYIANNMFRIISDVKDIKSNAKYAEIVKDFEENNNCLVYHAIESNTSFGIMLSLLYVGKSKTYWKEERLNENYITSCVYNINDDYSEYGDIFLQGNNGALYRIV